MDTQQQNAASSRLFGAMRNLVSPGLFLVFIGGLPAKAQETSGELATEVAPTNPSTMVAQVPPELEPPKGATRIDPQSRVWVDSEKKRVFVDGRVSQRRAVLEMFACPRGTKEHEAVVAVESRAFVIHAALLSIGAEPGKPVQWEPKYHPASGDKIAIEAQWLDQNGELQKTDARRWVRNLETKKAMTQHWVFGGSGFWKDEETSQEYYMAESGDLICVSNFGTAMLDIPIESSQSNEGLLFEAFTENVPTLGTPVRLVLQKADDKSNSKYRKHKPKQ